MVTRINITCMLLALTACGYMNRQVPHQARPGVTPMVAVRAEYGWCSGVWTGPTEVTTASHCSMKSPGIFAYNSRWYSGVVIQDPLQDLSTITSADVSVSHPWVSHRNPVDGELVEIREYSGAITRTRILSSEYVWRTAHIEFTPDHGQSGSPIFGEDGKIVCILSGKIVTPPYGGTCQIIR